MAIDFLQALLKIMALSLHLFFENLERKLIPIGHLAVALRELLNCVVCQVHKSIFLWFIYARILKRAQSDIPFLKYIAPHVVGH